MEEVTLENAVVENSLEVANRELKKKLTEVSTERTSYKQMYYEVSEELKQLKREIAEKETGGGGNAKELLDTMEDDSDEKAYIAVIGTTLLRETEIRKFASQCILGLHKYASHELMQYLFNGDTFKFVTPAMRNDFIIRGKGYQLDLSNIEEDLIIGKICMLFSKFKAVTFEYKIVGDGIQYSEQMETFSYNEEETSDSEDIEIGEEDLDVAYGNMVDVTYKLNAERVVDFNILGNFEISKLILVKYGNGKWLKVDSENEELGGSDFTRTAVKGISAILASVVIGTDFTEEKQNKFSRVLEKLEGVTNESNAYNIPFTKLYLCQLGDLQSALRIMKYVAKIGGAELTIVADISVPERNRQLVCEYELRGGYKTMVSSEDTESKEGYSDTEEEITLGVDFKTSVIHTKSSLKVLSKMIVSSGTVEFENNSGELVKMHSETKEQWKELIEAMMLGREDRIGNIGRLFNKIGCIERISSGVGVRCMEIKSSGVPYFIADVPAWQKPIMLMNIYLGLYGTDKIQIKCGADSNMLSFLLHEYTVYDAGNFLSIETLKKYLLKNK